MRQRQSVRASRGLCRERSPCQSLFVEPTKSCGCALRVKTRGTGQGAREENRLAQVRPKDNEHSSQGTKVAGLEARPNLSEW